MFWLIFGIAFGFFAGLMILFGIALARVAGTADEILGYKEKVR